MHEFLLNSVRRIPNQLAKAPQYNITIRYTTTPKASWSTSIPARCSSSTAAATTTTMAKQDISSLRLDPAVFNQSLYTSVLRNYLSTYPDPITIPGPADIKKWFGMGATPEEKAAFDAACRAISMPALNLLGPDNLSLPPFESFDADRKLYAAFAAPFVPEFGDERAKPDATQREEAALGLVVLLDQMTRNCLRGASEAVVFTHYDRLARALQHVTCEAGLDAVPRWKTAVAWRMWFDLPLTHSENLADHEVLREKRQRLVRELREAGDEEAVKFLEESVARDPHEETLRRFGRFPYRNEALGRESTKEEKEFLERGGAPYSSG